MVDMFPVVSVCRVDLAQANILLRQWQHKMGALARGNQAGVCHAMMHGAEPVAVTTVSTLIRECVGGADWLTRENCVELSRVCAARPGLNRAMLRLWREFVFPELGYQFVISYQDAVIHSGDLYRFDGWKRISRSRSGTDQRSGRKGRDKWVWLWERGAQT